MHADKVLLYSGINNGKDEIKHHSSQENVPQQRERIFLQKKRRSAPCNNDVSCRETYASSFNLLARLAVVLLSNALKSCLGLSADGRDVGFNKID